MYALMLKDCEIYKDIEVNEIELFFCKFSFSDFQPVPSSSKEKLPTKSKRLRRRRYQGFISEGECETDREFELKIKDCTEAIDSDGFENDGKLIFVFQ